MIMLVIHKPILSTRVNGRLKNKIYLGINLFYGNFIFID